MWLQDGSGGDVEEEDECEKEKQGVGSGGEGRPDERKWDGTEWKGKREGKGSKR